jgi:D-alanyl-D-alanine carboxypeptidase
MLSRVFPAIFAILFTLTNTAAASAPGPSLAQQAHHFPAPPVRARAAVVLDAKTGKMLMSVNPHLHLAIASTTKVMTAVLALQMGNLSDRITVPKSAFNYEWDATVMGLKAGEVVTLKDLLYGLMLPSGADAANTIAIHYGGSESKFVALMNQKAAALNMRDTHYLTAHGLDTPGQYSSAYDLALLGRYAATFPALLAIASTRTYTWNGHVLQNLNHVVNWYPGADGIKPGFTDAAGLCQLLDARHGGKHVVAAILNTPDMVIDARNLLNFGLSDFTWHQTSLTGDGPGLTMTAGPSAYYFPASGHYVKGKFWGAFRNDGQLQALGFPRTEPLKVGTAWVQYFQNGALSESASGKVTRLPIGLTPVPTPAPVSSPPGGQIPRRSASPRPKPLNPTSPTPEPTASPTATPVPLQPDKVFSGFLHKHPNMVGSPVSGAIKSNGYRLQTFRYGVLAYDPAHKTVWVLPLEDRILSSLGYLPEHPGNVYPSGFAPASVLKAIGWK